MKKIVCFCDLCDADGDSGKAIGSYVTEDGIEWDVCRKHIKNIKAAGYQVYEFDSDPPTEG